MRLGRETLERDVADRRRLVWLLITGEALTPRGQPGPLARPWAARSRDVEPRVMRHPDPSANRQRGG